MFKKFKFDIKSFFAIITFIIALVVLLFGDNITERFSGPELIIDSKIDDFPIPEKLLNLIDNEVSLPDSIRVMTIKNIGSKTSRNINIQIDTEGEIFQYTVKSTEIIKEHSLCNSSIQMQIERMSSDAEVGIVVWLKNDGKSFNANYADDIKNASLITDKEANENLNSLIIPIGVSSLGISISFLLSIFIKQLNLYLDNKNKLVKEEMRELLYKLESNDSEIDSANEMFYDVNDRKRGSNSVDEMKEILKISRKISKS
jgi:hypothetical protein